MREKIKFLVMGFIIASCIMNPSIGKSKVQAISLKEQIAIGADEVDANQMFFNLIGSFIDSKNNYYLLDKGNFRIQVFNKDGKFIRTIGKKGQGPGELASIVAGGIYDQKYVLVADDELLRVNVYDLEGNFISSFKIKGKVSDLICTPDNKIFIAYPDIEGRLIHEYDLKGNLIKSFGALKEKELTLFNDAVKMCMDAEGNFYVCIRYANRIQRYDFKGNLIKEIEADLPFTVRPQETKGGGYQVTSVFLDIACNGNDVYIITAPQVPAHGSIQDALKEGNYMIILDKKLNQKQISKLPYLTISLSFDNYQRLLLCDLNFIFHVCSVTSPKGE
ncbi:MAG: NHL repeat-containing protein [Acidobacteriota bacterium]|nr:NHL repeat-containing protein [Acidobacteriota bacterium]